MLQRKKLEPFIQILIKQKDNDLPWSTQLFSTKKGARDYLKKVYKGNGWIFENRYWEFIEVEIKPIR